MTPLTWNADREQLSAKKMLTQFSIGWKNYLNPGAGEPWRIITPEIQSDLSVTAFPGNVQFPTSSQGLTSMVFDSAFSMKRHIDERNGNNSEPEFALELQVESQHNITGTLKNLGLGKYSIPMLGILLIYVWECGKEEVQGLRRWLRFTLNLLEIRSSLNTHSYFDHRQPKFGRGKCSMYALGQVV